MMAKKSTLCAVGRARRVVRRGFTLIEMVATIVILAAIGTVASNILLAASDSYLSAAAGSQLTSELSMAMDRLVRELRQIDLDNDAAVEIGPDIDDFTATTITWNKQWTVRLNGTTLEIEENGEPAQTLLTDVSAFSLTAYDESNAPLAASLSDDSCDAIRRISCSITQTRYGTSATVRTKVFIRATMSGGGTDPS